MEIKEFVQDKLVCKVFKDRDEMGKYAAKQIADCIRNLLKEQESVNMIFAAAPSQNDMLHYLASESVDWGRVTAFHMDEYIGLDENSEHSFKYFLDKALFEKIPMKAVYYIGAGDDVEQMCSRYAKLLKEHPIDIVCLGIGENAHIAFNDPDVADFEDKQIIKKVQLDEICRQQQVNDKTFDSLDEVPKYALTLTVPTLLSAKYMFCVVPTSNKANAVYRTMEGEYGPDIPATAMRRHPHAIMFTDMDSAQLLLQQND
ncbi:MAG: glucosamine-6-phosphate deaminase [Candidatus Coproplasma sp.]